MQPQFRVVFSLLLLFAATLPSILGLRVQPKILRRSSSMRGRLGRSFVRLNAEESDEGGGLLKGLFTTNRDTPEAQANQLEWARQQMALEVPDETLDGAKIADREDMVSQYIVSEQEKFGRVVDRATAEAEVDEWLLKQATYAPAQTTGADLAIAGAVFVAAFGAGLYFAQAS